MRSGRRPTCAQCAHFEDDPGALERTFVGIAALSSAYGSSRGDAGVCRRAGTFHDPEPACTEFIARGVPAGHGVSSEPSEPGRTSASEGQV
jgi:hypothetical protein